MNIYQKLIEVRKSVPYLQKDSQMTSGQSYKYNSSSQVIGAVRKEMDEKNLLLITKIMDKRVHMDTVENKDNTGKVKRTTTFFTELDLMMVWVNGDEPTETVEVPWYGQGIDTAGEKGVGKALTYAEKTFLLKEFNIATDQMDVDAFQDKMEKTVGRITSNAIAQLKSEWIGKGYKANALGARVKELYSCGVSDLSEDQANELLEKIRSHKGQSA
ncbi:ERF family protein [Paenibacillus rigui]|uniref:Single-stranded DNA-binding protein n=1 Tax=Paenibacillus rigui TaxID=554312 RepID=A0A229UKU3_9BACL|nr:ERF family protein [Paenibacillus rigui]OXM84002.1 hypothetical protein CF651_23100 [Paenibacillus rigui]